MRMWFSQDARESERGQSLVEMTVGFVILAIILMGILDIGRVYFLYLALEDAAGEAALYLSANPACAFDPNPGTAGDECDDPHNALYRAKHSGSGYIDWSMIPDEELFELYIPDPLEADGLKDVDNLDGLSQGDPFTVSLHYPYQVLTPIVSAITRGEPISLSAFASSIVFVEP